MTAVVVILILRFCDTMIAPMKKPIRPSDEPERKAPRADRPPTEGFVVIVDGHFKSELTRPKLLNHRVGN